MAEWSPPPVPRSAQVASAAAAIRSATFTLRRMGTFLPPSARHRLGGEHGPFLPSVGSRALVPPLLGRDLVHRAVLPCPV
eukprot:4257034-Pyramimonas_sp.AAC.1